jgi:PfaB family protein
MEKIAVIGLACLFPDAQTPEQFWQNLLAQKNSISQATQEQMGVDPKIFYDPVKGKTGETGKYYCQQGGFIKNFQFELTGYRIAPYILESLDNIYQWSLYVAKQALQDSGYLDNLDVLAKCGVILGNLSSPTRSSYHQIAPIYQKTIESAVGELLHRQDFQLDRRKSPLNLGWHNVLTAGYPSAIIADALALSGINFSLDAACASSLYSVKLACDYLISRQSDLMLAGGVSCTDPLMTHVAFSLFQAYPDDSNSSCPLDELSAGLITGEGAGMLVLKRYSDALRDGDKIYATILGTGLSNDGKGKHFLSPNPKGQILAFERAYGLNGIEPQSIDYVECHGTGTPLGDRTELNSMEAFFGRYGASPKIGSVKSNLGHLLTAAGMPSLLKVILGMSHGLIPPTIKVSQALSSSDSKAIATENVVRSVTPWLSQNGRKRAAVSAFGFGGTNSHLILESHEHKLEVGGNDYLHQERDSDRGLTREAKMAIVGMGAFFGSCHDLDAFDRCIYEGSQSFIPLPKGRWQGVEQQQQLLEKYGFDPAEAPLGAYIKDFNMDCLHFKIPPDTADRPIPQQLLALKVADAAIADAGLKQGSNVATIVAMGTELASHKVRTRCDLFSWQIEQSLTHAGISLSSEQVAKLKEITRDSLISSMQVNQGMSFIGNIMASRISALWDFSGPCFTLSAEENSTYKALEVAQMFLEENLVDAVVVASVDLSGGVENVLLRQQTAKVNTGVPTLSYDVNVNGPMVGEGAGAVVLKRLDRAKQDRDKIYAIVDAISLVQATSTSDKLEVLPRPPESDAVKQACQQAFQKAGVTPEQIGYLEVFGSGISAEDEAEIQGLHQAYQLERAELNCAIGSVKANIGHTYAASGMASLIKTALCLYQQYIPPTPQWSSPKHPERWQDSSFYVATASQSWFLGVASTKRIAAINGLGIDRTYAHLILSEDPTQLDRSNRYLQQQPFYLFTIAAPERSALLAQIDTLQKTIEDCDDLAKAAARTYATFQEKERGNRANYAVAIVGSNKKELNREIQRALSGVERAFTQGGDWKTPLGSYFTAKPLGKRGSTAFVYSGGFTSYLGMASSLGHLFPKGFNDLASFPATKGKQRRIHTSSQAIYPRSLQKLSKKQVEALEAKLLDNSETMLMSGSFIAQYYTKILRNYFQVQPQAAFGYSLGEVSMMVALDIWNDDDSMAEHMESSSLFKTRIDGPKNAVREYWGLPPKEETANKDFWSTYVLLSGVDRVRDCLKNEDRVYITHINTPEEVAIAGDAKSCIRVIEKLGCSYFPAPFSVAIHSQPILSELGELTKLFTLPTQDGSQVKFYSSAECVPIAIDTHNVASQIARGICQQVNFPRLIDRVYDDGARIFIEVGAGNSCCRWVRETLKQKEQLVLSLNSRGVDDRTSMVRALAQLFSHCVSLDLSPLYCDLEVTSSKKKSLTTTINLGGEAIASKILTAQNRQKFAHPAIPIVAESSLKASPSFAQQQKLELTGVRSAIASASIKKESERASPPTPPTRGTNKEQQILEFNRAKLASPSYRELHKSTLDMGSRVLNTTKSPSFLPSSEMSPRDRYLSLVLPRHKPAHVLFDEKELLEFAEGKVGRVFGSEYASVDSYPKRARLPLPPFLFVSRVTKLDAKKGCFEPCSIETEYDIPQHAWYAFDGQVPIAIPLEASHSSIFLVSYLGIDFEAKGQRVFRNLGGSTTFLGDAPRIGDTLRCRTRINSFSRFGETFLLFFTYECFVGERMFLKMESGGGLFSQQELERGQGIITNEREKQKERIQQQHFQPLLSCPKTVFDPEDFAHLAAGDLAACFGSNYEQNGRNTSLCMPPLPIRMFDRVLSLDSQGGNWGLGSVIAEKTLDPQHWYFNCHFKDDYCLPGTLLTEGCTQLLAFYMLYCGLQTQTNDARFQPVTNVPQIGRYRGQIQPIKAKLTYRLEVTEIGLTPKPFAMANATIEFEGKTITMLKNIGICLSEKNRSIF